MLVDWAKKNLWNNPEWLTWLKEKKGLSEETIQRNELGYIPQNIWRDRTEWGMGNGKKLWFPQSLVLPYRNNGRVVRVRFRRPSGEPRYVPLSGSCMAPGIYGTNRDTLIIVESDLDAMLLEQEGRDLISSISMGNATNRPDEETAKVIKAAKRVFISLDSDSAGIKESWQWWLDKFRNSLRVPIVGGKDPSEAWGNGLDLNEWIHAGLGLFEPAPVKSLTEKQESVPTQTNHHDLSIELRGFFQRSIIDGSGLHECKSKEQAEEYLQIIDPVLPKDMGVCIVRDKEINIYSWE